MNKIIVGEKVVNKRDEIGVISSFDDKYIYVKYNNRIASLMIDAFEKGILRYENNESQLKLEDCIKESSLNKKIESEKQAMDKEMQIRKNEERIKLFSPDKNTKYESINVRLEPAIVVLLSVKAEDRYRVKKIFDECDRDSQNLFDSFEPRMDYPKLTSKSKSKYCAAFLTKYDGVYVLRVFSRNDIYKKRVRTGVTVFESDTTEIMRVLYLNGETYYFSKNLSYAYGKYNNVSYSKIWVKTYLQDRLILKDVINKCDCKYLNEYISQKDINVSCDIYAGLLFDAIYDNRSEIVFKHKLFLSASRIADLPKYLKDYSFKQIEFASENNCLNALSFIKRNGIYDAKITKCIEGMMRRDYYFRSNLYDHLVDTLNQLHLNQHEVDKKIIRFIKKVDVFDVRVYRDYIYDISRLPDVSVDDFFDKNYISRHNVMVVERRAGCTIQTYEEYLKVAKELSWINRKENGYYIIVPKTIEDFKEEGSAQHNCVFTNRYYQDVINRRSIIVFLRKEVTKPFITIEYDYETFEVIQALGKYNSEIDCEIYDFIVDLGKKLDYERFSEQ